MRELKARRFQLIQCVATTSAASQQYMFDQQPLLQSITGGQMVFVQKIKCYAANALTKTPLATDNAAATAADIQGATLTLSVLGQLRIRNIPLSELVNVWSNDTSYVPFTMDSPAFVNMWMIDWTQSFITTMTAVHAAPLSFNFGIYYAYATDIQEDIATEKLVGLDPYNI